MRMPRKAANPALVATHIAARGRVKEVSQRQGWTLRKVAGEEDYRQAVEEIRAEGVVVKEGPRAGEVEFTQQKRTLYRESQWSHDAKEKELFEYVPRNVDHETTFRGGQKLHARIMRGLESLDAV